MPLVVKQIVLAGGETLLDLKRQIKMSGSIVLPAACFPGRSCGDGSIHLDSCCLLQKFDFDFFGGFAQCVVQRCERQPVTLGEFEINRIVDGQILDPGKLDDILLDP